MKRSHVVVTEPTRRDILGGAATLTVAASTWPRTTIAQSKTHQIKVGTAEVTVLTDGTMAMPLGWVLPDRKPDDIEAAFKQAGPRFSALKLAELTLQVNVALIRLGPELILIDAGGGHDFAPARGKLADNLEQAGIKPEAVTKVIFTHAHPDHFWGLIDPLDGASMFPKARHFLSIVERDYWRRPGVETGVPEAVRGAAIGTRRRLEGLGDRIETFTVGAEIVPGLTMLDTSGHSPGHISVLLRSGAEQLLIGGDALIEPVISFARPQWRWGPDWDQDRAISSRLRLLDMLATDNTPLLGYHLPWPGVGRVERSANAYRFVQP